MRFREVSRVTSNMLRSTGDIMHGLHQGELAQGNPSSQNPLVHLVSRQTQAGMGEEKHWWDTEDPVTQGCCL